MLRVASISLRFSRPTRALTRCYSTVDPLVAEPKRTAVQKPAEPDADVPVVVKQKRVYVKKPVDPDTPVVKRRSRKPPTDPLLADVIKEPKPKGPKRRIRATPEETNLVAANGELPPILEWRKYFQTSMDCFNRVSVRNPKTAAALAEAFVPKGSVGKVVIEAFPGQPAIPIISSFFKFTFEQGRASLLGRSSLCRRAGYES